MFQSGSTKLIRNLNKRHILNLVRMNQGISGREICKQTGLQISTVLYTLKILRKQGLVTETGLGVSTLQGGKPPRLWDINPNYGFILGAELLSKEIRLVLLDFKAGLLSQTTQPLSAIRTPQRLVQKTAALIRKFTKKNKLEFSKILGLGIGMPGLIDSEQGMVRFSAGFGLRDVPLKELLQHALPIPVKIDNEANAAALGIKWYEKNAFLNPNLLYINIQQNFSGMGLGLIINHRLYRGAHNSAGELGSFLDPQDRRRIWAKARKRFPAQCPLCRDEKSASEPSLAEAVNNALNGDAGAVYILRELAKAISKKLVILINLLDPQSVVIGGDICAAQPYIESIIRQRIPSGIISKAARQTPVHFSAYGAYSSAMGGAALILENIFNQQ